jgi:hypothetical protein
VPDLDGDADRACGADDPQTLVHRCGEWLLDEDRDPSLDRRERERHVRRRRRGDDDSVELGFREHRERLGEPLRARLRDRSVERVRNGVCDRHEADVGPGGQDAEVVPAHRTEAGEPDAERFDRGPVAASGHRTAAVTALRSAPFGACRPPHCGPRG